MSVEGKLGTHRESLLCPVLSQTALSLHHALITVPHALFP